CGCHSGRASRDTSAFTCVFDALWPGERRAGIQYSTARRSFRRPLGYWVPALRSPSEAGLAWPGRRPHAINLCRTLKGSRWKTTPMTYHPAALHKDMLQRMWLIRSFEERVIELIHRKQLAGLVHVGIGQEGVAVGIATALGENDYLYGTHRSHGHFLARG